MDLHPHSMVACPESGEAPLGIIILTWAALAPQTECSDTTPFLVRSTSFNKYCCSEAFIFVCYIVILQCY